MEGKLFSTDEEIIKEYLRLFNTLGCTKECLTAVKNLTKQIASKQQFLWKPILEGLQQQLQGDGFELPTPYNYTEHYLKACEILTGVAEKIEDKNSILFAFVEKYRIDALALSRSKDVNEVITLYDDLTNKFREDENDKIKACAVSAMLSKSFVLWQINKDRITDDIIQQVKNIEKDIIDTFSSCQNPDIQVIVAKCFNNHANTIEKEHETFEGKSNEKRDELLNLFGNSDDDALKVQVAKAMLNKASTLEELKAVDEVRNKWKKDCNSKDYDAMILDAYSTLIDNFRDSDIMDIQKNVALAMSQKSYILSVKGQLNETLNIYNELINKFKNNKNELISSLVCGTFYLKGLLLGGFELFNDANETFAELINTYKGYSKTQGLYGEIQFYIVKAMMESASILRQQDKYNEAVNLLDEVEQRCLQYENKDIYFEALKTKADILTWQAVESTGMEQEEKFKQSIETRMKILGLYRNDNNLEMQVKIAEVMMNIAFNKNFLKCYQEAIECFQEIITTYNTDEYKQYEVFVKLVYDAECKKAEAMMNMAIIKANHECFQEAIECFQEIITAYNTDEYQQYETFAKLVYDAEKDKQKVEYFLPVYEVLKYFQTNEDAIRDLIESINEKTVIPVIGAGLSQFMYPLWQDFLSGVFNKRRSFLNDISPEEFSQLNCKKQASVLKQHIKEGLFEDEVRLQFRDKDVEKDLIEKQPIWLLPDLFKRGILLTTNFDNLVKRVFGLHDDPHFVQCTPADISKIEEKRPTETLLYKIHGSVDAYKDVILTDDDFYKTYDPKSDAYQGMQKALKGMNILFLGCSLREGHEILEFCKSKDSSTVIYAICPCEDDETKKTELVRKLAGYGVNASILYPKDNHAYLYIILDYIRRCIA